MGGGGSIALTLMATFMIGCIKPWRETKFPNTKCENVLQFHLFLILRDWTLSYLLSLMENVIHPFDLNPIRQWSARTILLQNDTMDAVGWFPKQPAKTI